VGKYKKNKNNELLKELKSVLNTYQIHPKKKLSQHFLINPILIDWHIEFANLIPNDVVLEIGSGIGTLTRSLVQRVKKVIAIEIDKQLIKVLRNRLSAYKNVEIIQSNILELETTLFRDKKVISNLPYKISSPLLFKLFKTDYKMAILTLQKEFAERLIAKPNTKSYGKISVTSNFYSDIKILKIIPNSFFYPIPKVDSALVKIKPKCNKIEIRNHELFNKLVNTLFTQKNKILEKVLKKFILKHFDNFKSNEIILEIPYIRKRIRELTPETIIELSNLIDLKVIRNKGRR